MKSQEVFDKVVAHLGTQREKCEITQYEHTNCFYRRGSLKCAAGCLIEDWEYDKQMERRDWLQLAAFWPAISERIGNTYLVQRLQMVHDRFDVKDWPFELRMAATENNLDPSIVDKFWPLEEAP